MTPQLVSGTPTEGMQPLSLHPSASPTSPAITKLLSRVCVVVFLSEMNVTLSCKPLVPEMELQIRSGPASLCFSSELSSVSCSLSGTPDTPALVCVVKNVRPGGIFV